METSIKYSSPTLWVLDQVGEDFQLAFVEVEGFLLYLQPFFSQFFREIFGEDSVKNRSAAYLIFTEGEEVEDDADDVRCC